MGSQDSTMTARTRFGVIFDMDGVLVDSAQAHWRSWRILGERQGVAIEERLFSETFGRQNRDIVPLFFGNVAESESIRLAEAKEEIYRGLVVSKPPVVAGAVELVRGLREFGAALAVGSSGPLANIAMLLSGMGVRDCFETLVCAEDVSRGKPHPEVFALAASRLGVSPIRCVVIEDAPAGVAAAKAAGAKCAAVMMHHDRSALSAADLIVERLAELTPRRVAALVGA